MRGSGAASFAIVAIVAIVANCADSVSFAIDDGYVAFLCSGGTAELSTGLLKSVEDVSLPAGGTRMALTWSPEDFEGSCAPKDDSVLARHPIRLAVSSDPAALRLPSPRALNLDSETTVSEVPALTADWPRDALCRICCLSKDMMPRTRSVGCEAEEKLIHPGECGSVPQLWCCTNPENTAPPKQRNTGCHDDEEWHLRACSVEESKRVCCATGATNTVRYGWCSSGEITIPLSRCE